MPVSKILYQGREIVVLDFTNQTKEEILENCEAAKALIKTYPEQSCLTLTKVKNMTFDKDVAEAFKQLAVNNKPYVKAAALLNCSGFQRVIYVGVIALTKREMQLFDDQTEALEWLVGH